MIRCARIATETIHVICPYCGADQPNVDGTSDWTKEDVSKLDTKVIKCESCDKPMKVLSQTRAQID